MMTARRTCAQSKTSRSFFPARPTSAAWYTSHEGFSSRSHAAIALGTFWSRRTANGSGTPDDLLLVDHLAGVVERFRHILAGELRVSFEHPFNRVPPRDHSKDVLHHDSSPAD